MYRLRYTLRDKRLKGTDTHLQFLIAQALPRWEKLIEALSALDERLLTFINSPPLLQEAPADASGGTFTARIHKADGSTSFYNEEDLVEEEAGENEDGRSGATRDEGDSSPDGSPDARRMIPFGIVGASSPSLLTMPPYPLPPSCPWSPSHHASVAQPMSSTTWSTRRFSSSSRRMTPRTRST